MDARPLIAAQFRQLATEYLSGPANNIEDRAGKLVIAAYHRGYLPGVPGLDKLVDWVENPPEAPKGVQAWFMPCPTNLFHDLCGQHQIHGWVGADGKVSLADNTTHGGILPEALPDVLPGVPIGANEERDKARQRAAICEWLAVEVEKDSPHKATPTTPTAEASFVFKRVGDIWSIRFDGAEYQCQDSKALSDVRYLLDHVGHPVGIFDLPGNEGRGDRGTRAVDSTSLDNAKRIRRQIAELEEGIRGLDGSDDPADIFDREEQEAQRDALEKQYNENFGKHGLPRQLAGDEAKAVGATQVRINRFKDRLRDHLPGFADHLDGFLTIAPVCQYAPDRPIPWELA